MTRHKPKRGKRQSENKPALEAVKHAPARRPAGPRRPLIKQPASGNKGGNAMADRARRITRASARLVQEIPPPVRLRTTMLDLALQAEKAGAEPPPGATPLPDDDTDEPPTTTVTAVPNPSNLIPYVELPPLPDYATLSSRTRSADKEKSAAKRCKMLQERDARDKALYGGYRRYDTPAVFRVLKGAQEVELDVDLDFDVNNKEERVFPVASTGWTGTRVTHTDEEREPHDLDWFMRNKFRLIEADGKFPMLFVDSQGHVIFAITREPLGDRTWKTGVHDVLVKELEEAESKAKFSPAGPNRRDTKALNFGVSMGGGQTKPQNIAAGSNEEIIERLRKLKATERAAGFMDSGFRTLQRRMYLFYESYMLRLRRAHPELRFNFDRNVFAAATFNLGPRSVARVHTDDKNFAAGWCAIMALGNFDPKKGGHMVLWELKLVIEFPPASVMYIPSAILSHSNTTIAPGEKRMSFTQFTAGGLFRWVDCGFQTQKDFFAAGGRHEKTGADRWNEAIGRYSTFESVMDQSDEM